jgi:hypothetical protein
MNKKHIQIFAGKQNGGSCCNTSGGSGCCCGTPSDSIPFDELIKKYIAILDGIADFNIYNVSDEQDNVELISNLNTLLSKNGENLIVDKSNLEFVLSQSAPIIAVDDKIISMKNYPDEKLLYDAVMSGKKIPVKKGCC